MLYDFSGLKLPQLQTVENLRDKGRKLIILESVERVLYACIQLVDLPLSIELELLLSFSLYLLCQMLFSLLHFFKPFFFYRILNC